MPVDLVAERVAHLLQTAPGWCRVGLTAPSAAVRERATRELATLIAARLDEPLSVVDHRQLALPISG